MANVTTIKTRRKTRIIVIEKNKNNKSNNGNNVITGIRKIRTTIMEITGIRKIIGTKEMAGIRTVTLRMTIRKIAAIMW